MVALAQCMLSALYFTICIVALPSLEGNVDKRAVCTSDAVLSALRAHTTETASWFCQSLILPRTSTFIVKPAQVTPAPVIVTSTVTFTRSVYPGYPAAPALEQLPFPSYVSQYPAARVSSGCSCLLGPSTTETSTATGAGATATSTVYTTALATLTGPCASNIQYPGAYSLVSQTFWQEVFTSSIGLSDAYACCNLCYSYVGGHCVLYDNILGSQCNYMVANLDAIDNCKATAGTAAVEIARSSVPNNIGGKGPCAGQITTIAK